MPDFEITPLINDIVMLYKGLDKPTLSKEEIAQRIPGVSDEELQEALDQLKSARILKGGEQLLGDQYWLSQEIVFD